MRRLLAFLLLALCTMAARAEDRALLIGVGQYREPGMGADLPGIELDLGVMQEVAESLGFKPTATKVLLNQQATLAAVRQALQQWLVEGTSAGDRVLLYYSGHGTQLPDEDGDEDDGLDEAWTLHDMAPARRHGRATLDGVLLDDELAETLARIPSQQVLVLVDACHSGTSTRAGLGVLPRLGAKQAVGKFYRVPQAEAAPAGVKRKVVRGNNHLAISAARDAEQSLATERGSVFTMALREAIAARRDAGQVSMRELWHEATVLIASKLDGPLRFHPQLDGNLAMADVALPLPSLADGGGAAWRKVEQLSTGETGVSVAFSQPRYAEGAAMRLEVRSTRAGYLHVVSVGPDGVPLLLFPNAQHRAHRVSAGAVVTLPTPSMRIGFTAGQPFGRTLVAAIVTREPLDLYAVADGEHDETGVLQEVVGQLSALGLQQLQSLQARAEKGAYAAGRTTVRVCPPSGECR
ncbi:MAG: caspase family protein [Rhizobacter sp.]|nr:caspase family protein [Rhizobacter sp.]